jgi:hypothetical protein
MIVLDEQLLGRNLEKEIAKWYRGKVLIVTDLRLNSVIKDDALPELLRRQIQPTFVTINEKDFWHKISVDNRFALPGRTRVFVKFHLRYAGCCRGMNSKQKLDAWAKSFELPTKKLSIILLYFL